MNEFCFLGDREYEIVYFSSIEQSYEDLIKASKIKKKILFHIKDVIIDPKFLSYMLKLFRCSIKNDFEIFFIIKNKNIIEDINLFESKRYFKIFDSIEEYNELKIFAGYEVKIYDDNNNVKNLLKDELIKNGFGIKDRNSFNFLNKKHDSRSNSIYIIDFSSYQEEKIEEIKKIKKENPNSMVILITFETDIDNALNTMKYGVNRVVKRPVDIKSLVGTIKSLATAAELKKENDRLVSEVFNREKEIRKLYNEVSEELKLAGDIQKSLMPPKKIDFGEYTCEYFFEPSMNIGGDFCDFIELNDEEFAIVFADISGHGIPASLLSTMLKVLIYNNAKKVDKVTELMEILNEEIINIFPKGKFVSMFYLVINTKTNRLRYAKASQEPALMYNKEKDEVIELESEGQILGLFSKKLFPILSFEEKEIDFNVGDKILLYTDGITEEIDDNGNYYGLERLKSQVKKLDLNMIIQDLKDFVGKKPFNDDVTLLKIKRRGEETC
ncbi:PP2C family protein-serine/threonine phosphatase [Streptobacillus moniliformis]|uniref:PP2C family protein-serine/threonine phosphatase n=1 Tax=Streptobacillus moniliformis TaxID=34105 RepID=UPI0007E3CBF2|nr:PP2C family protein-serine/threonine phosphatase [Streptobacillus moniliformis]